MGHKIDNSNLVSFLTLISFSTLVLASAGQVFPLLFPVVIIQLLLPGSSSFVKKVYYPLYLCFGIFVGFLIIKTHVRATLAIGLPKDCIISISGTLIYDSSFTQLGANYITISIDSAKSIFGQTVTAKGLVNAIGDTKAIITSGTKVILHGRFSDDFFKYKTLQVTNLTALCRLREQLITAIEKRLFGNSTRMSEVLSAMLLLGRAETYNSSIKTLAANCGCSHVLALSGMHLNTLNLVFKPIKIKWLKYMLSVLMSVAFIFIAGPRPSLVRALLMLIFNFLPLDERITMCYVAQLLIFPFSMINMGCVYSYLSIFALIFLSPILQEIIRLKGIASSIAVVTLIAPLSIITDGFWHPISIIASPISGVLIILCMFTGFLILVFGQVSPLLDFNEKLYIILENTFEFFEKFNTGTWQEYIILVAIVALLVGLIPISKRIMKQRFKKITKNPIIKL